MKTEDLLAPRFKVIDDYPESPFEIGKIIKVDSTGYFRYPPNVACQKIYNPKKHPNIFKPLAWWEEREIGDMPEYIIGKHHGYDHYVKVELWDERESTYPSTTVNGVTYYAAYSTPITEEQYNAFKQCNP